MKSLFILIFLFVFSVGNQALADTSCTSWQPVTSMQKSRTGFAGGVINGKIYVFGGGNEVDNTVEKTLEVFDPATGEWTFLAENGQDVNEGGQFFYDQGVEEISAAVLNNKLYVFGADILHAPTDNFNWVYDPTTDQWKMLASKPTTVKSPMVTTYNGEIYLFGGQYLADDNSVRQNLKVVEAYNPTNDTWRQVTNMPYKISATVIVTVGNRAYIIGGGADSSGYESTESGPYDALQQVYAYDFQTDTWITSGLGSLDRPMVWPGANSATAVVNGKVYLTGGITTIDPSKWNLIYDYDLIPTNRVLTYDTGTHQFSEEESLPYLLFGHLTVRVDEDVYALGGQTIWESSRDNVLKLGCSSCGQSMPEIVAPQQNSIVNTSTVTFQWSSSGLSFPMEIQANDGTPVFTGTITSSQQKIIPGLPDGAYRWRIAASSDACTSNWSGWVSFYVEFAPPANVVALYPLDIDTNDYSGSDLHGTPQGGVAPTDGISGGAGAFNGTDASISLPSSYYTGDNYSYSMWVRPNQLLSPTARTIFSVQNAFFIKYENNDVQLYSDTVQKDVTDILSENVWTHLAFVYRKNVNNGSIAVYKNGSYVTEVTEIELNSDLTGATIGANGSSEYMRGSIDDLRVYNTNLNAMEIQALYAEKVNTTEFSDKSKAIILAGGGNKPGNWLWEDTKRVTDFAYNALLWQGYTKDNIYYLNSVDDDVDDNGLTDDVDAEASLANLEAAITTWAADADNLVLYLADHGGDKTFQVQYGIESEVLQASTLASWLDDLQEVMAGRIIIIYEACYSGSFVDPLKVDGMGSNRILITSSGAQEKSKFQEYGRLSFSYQFWAGVYEGAKLAEAFNHGNNMMTAQSAWYDTDSNGLPNTYSDIFPDIVIGPGFLSAHNQPIIIDKSPAQAIKTVNSAPLWAKVNSANNVIVWAMIVPPEYDPSAPDTPATELPIVQLNYSATNDRYQGTFDGFSAPGVYSVSFYAMDDKGGISSPQTSTVEKRDKQPYPWILFIPVLGAATK